MTGGAALTSTANRAGDPLDVANGGPDLCCSLLQDRDLVAPGFSIRPPAAPIDCLDQLAEPFMFALQAGDEILIATHLSLPQQVTNRATRRDAKRTHDADAARPVLLTRRSRWRSRSTDKRPDVAAAVLAHHRSAVELAVEDASPARRRNAVKTAILPATIA